MGETWTEQGGYLSNVSLNKRFQVAAQPLMKFRQFCDFKSSLGKNAGESENFLKVSNLGTVGGSLTETNVMIESSQAKAWGTISMNEYGNSIPLTFKVSTLSKFDLEKIIRQGLMDDMAKCLDGLVEREFNSTVLRYVGTATAAAGVLTTNGTATVTNTSILNTLHLRKMILELKKRNVPGYSNGDYVMIASHEAVEGLQGALESVFQYTEAGMGKNFNGEIGRYFGCRIVEDGFGSRYTYSASARTATAKSWTQAQSLDAYMFGSPTVMEAIAVPEEVRVKEVTDYGRSHGIAWYFLGGYELVWATAADARIIKWDSAA